MTLEEPMEGPMSAFELEMLQRHKTDAARAAGLAVIAGLVATGLFLLPLSAQMPPGNWLLNALLAVGNVWLAGWQTSKAVRSGLTMLVNLKLYTAIRPAPGWESDKETGR